MRAAIYCRISKDRGGEGLGVERQQQDCEALAERLGWTVVGVYVDNDVSAYRKIRPEWSRLMGDFEAGHVGAIVCWDVDRLTRKPRELEDVITYAEDRGLALATTAGEINLATLDGRLTARIKGAVARMETEQKQKRQRRERKQSAQAGKVNGGGMRPYGYDDDRITALEDEAAIIRECAKRVLFGETLTSLARDLQRRDIRTPAGNHWQARTLRRMLGAARISGRREHKPGGSYDKTPPLVGEIVGEAQWPAIITVEDSDRLRQLLDSPGRQTTGAGNPRTYLLSGLLRCGRCGAAMVGHARAGVPRYVCRTMPGTNWCGGIVTNAERTDAHVRDLVLAALATPKLREARQALQHTDPALFSAVEQDRQQLDELADMWANRELSRAEWQRARTTVQARLTANERRLTRATLPDPLDGFLGSYDEMQARWASEQMTNSRRRVVLDAVVEQVVVGAAKPKKGAKAHWDPERFDIKWQDQS